MSANLLDDEFFIKNAISCWLYHFPEHKWTPIYEDLIKRDFTATPKPTPKPPRRARTQTKSTPKKGMGGPK